MRGEGTRHMVGCCAVQLGRHSLQLGRRVLRDMCYSLDAMRYSLDAMRYSVPAAPAERHATPRAGPTCRVNMQGQHVGPTCRTHMQGLHALICRAHMCRSLNAKCRDTPCPCPGAGNLLTSAA